MHCSAVQALHNSSDTAWLFSAVLVQALLSSSDTAWHFAAVLVQALLSSSGTAWHFSALSCTAQQFRHCLAFLSTVMHCTAVQALPSISQHGHSLLSSSGTAQQFRHCLAFLSTVIHCSAVQALHSSSGTAQQFRHCLAFLSTVVNFSAVQELHSNSGTAWHLTAVLVKALSCTAQQFRRSPPPTDRPPAAADRPIDRFIDRFNWSEFISSFYARNPVSERQRDLLSFLSKPRQNFNSRFIHEDDLFRYLTRSLCLSETGFLAWKESEWIHLNWIY